MRVYFTDIATAPCMYSALQRAPTWLNISHKEKKEEKQKMHSVGGSDFQTTEARTSAI